MNVKIFSIKKHISIKYIFIFIFFQYYQRILIVVPYYVTLTSEWSRMKNVTYVSNFHYMYKYFKQICYKCILKMKTLQINYIHFYVYGICIYKLCPSRLYIRVHYGEKL